MARVRIEYTANATFNVPTGITSITVECWAGGGGGGNGSSLFRGGGGKGGGYSRSTVTVVPENSHNVLVGAGGAATLAGGNSVFRNAANSADTVRAAGGNAGANGTGLAAGAGATTHVTTHLGDTTYNGGNGFNGGSGGGGAGSTGAGGNATAVGTPGTGTSEGGGDGSNNEGPGYIYGGAGGGGPVLSGAGMAGAQGKVVITFDSGTETVTASDDFSKVSSFNRTIDETATASDSNVKSYSAPKSDKVAVTYDGVIKNDNPLAYWRLNDTSGTTAVDASGNGRDATYAGSPTLNQPGLVPTDTDTAVRFTGTSQNATAAYNSVFNLSSGFTIEGWINPIVLPAGGGVHYIITKGTFRWFLRFSGTGILSGGYTDASSVVKAVSSNTGEIVAGQKYYGAVKWDGSTVTLYKNGVPIGTPLSSSSAIGTNAQGEVIGFLGSGTTPSVVIDEVAVYDYALTDEQILAHYNAGDRMTKTIMPNKSDSVAASDANTKYVQKVIDENLTADDYTVITLVFIRTPEDTATTSDEISKYVQSSKTDSVSSSDDSVRYSQLNKSDSVAASDEVSTLASFDRTIEDDVTATDSLSKLIQVRVDDNISGSAPPPVTGNVIFAVLD